MDFSRWFSVADADSYSTRREYTPWPNSQSQSSEAVFGARFSVLAVRIVPRTHPGANIYPLLAFYRRRRSTPIDGTPYMMPGSCSTTRSCAGFQYSIFSRHSCDTPEVHTALEMFSPIYDRHQAKVNRTQYSAVCRGPFFRVLGMQRGSPRWQT